MLRASLEVPSLEAVLNVEKQGYNPLLPELYAQFKLRLLMGHNGDFDKDMVNLISIDDLQAFVTREGEGDYYYMKAIAILNSMAERVGNSAQQIRDLQLQYIAANEYFLPEIPIHGDLMNRLTQTQLLKIVINWWSHHIRVGREVSQPIIDYLKSQAEPGPRYAVYITTLLSQEESRDPDLVVTHPAPGVVRIMSISPDLNYLVYNFGEDQWVLGDNYLLNRATGTRRPFYFWWGFWSPDSKKVVEIAEGKITVTDVTDGVVARFTVQSADILLGWQDSDTVLWYRELTSGYQVYAYSLSDKAIKELNKLSTRPSLTLTNSVGAVEVSAQEIKVTLNNVTRTYANSFKATEFHSWMPGDAGIVLWSSEKEQYCFFTFATGQFTPFDLPIFWPTSIWLDDSRLFVGLQEQQFYSHSFFIYDINSRTLQFTGFFTGEFGGNLMSNHFNVFDRVWFHKNN